MFNIARVISAEVVNFNLSPELVQNRSAADESQKPDNTLSDTKHNLALLEFAGRSDL